jgi:predicted deacetylase
MLAKTTSYLIRFDDVCPTMNWKVWDAVEIILKDHGISPIIAVVPDNQDERLNIQTPEGDFWERVRGWQASGWMIALHGHLHLYTNHLRGILKMTPQSEFAGVDSIEQERKLRAGAEIFKREQVVPQAWIAPSHSFDQTTVDLLPRIGIHVISDGLWPWPFTDSKGMTWLPCQLWDFQPRRSGVWTVCYHINTWNSTHLDRFRSDLDCYVGQVISPHDALKRHQGHRLTIQDRMWAHWDYFRYHQLRTGMMALRNKANSGLLQNKNQAGEML